MPATAKIISSLPTTPDWAVEGVPVENITDVWAEAWPFLQKAIVRFPNVAEPFTEQMLLESFVSRLRQLWIAWDFVQECIAGALVTEIVTGDKWPGAKGLSIPLVGGRDWNKWGDAMWTTIKAWGVSHRCTHALGYGRKGWCRLYGFDKIGKTADGIDIFVRRLKG
jgi:hypothetical protein